MRARFEAAWRRSPRLWLVLAALVVCGIGLRAWLSLTWRPALLGWPDTTIYLRDAGGTLFTDPLRVEGYALFLRVLHGISDSLSLVSLVQHALGIGTALLLFGAVRRAGASGWAGLVPAAVVLLGGTQLILEHAVLTEALFAFLAAAGLYAALRARAGSAWWAASCGALLGAASTVRAVGVVLVVLAVVALALDRRGRVRAAVLRGGLAAAVAGIALFGYVVAHHDATGVWGLSRTSTYNLYGRVAPFADCSKFEPPAGTSVLCEGARTQRWGPNLYLFDARSPAVRALGAPTHVRGSEERSAKLRVFSRAVVLNQPLDYAAAVATDAARWVVPSLSEDPGDGVTPSALADALFARTTYHENQESNALAVASDRGWTAEKLEKPSVNSLRSYEQWARLDGPVIAILLTLAVIAPFLTRRLGVGYDATLLTLFAFALLLVPTATVGYDYRYVVPGLGPLAAAAGVGAWAIAARRLDRRRAVSAA